MIKYDANLHLSKLKEILLRKILPQSGFEFESILPGRMSYPIRSPRHVNIYHNN